VSHPEQAGRRDGLQTVGNAVDWLWLEARASGVRENKTFLRLIILCEISGSHGDEYEVNSSGMLHRVVRNKFTDVSEEPAIVLLMETARTPETLVDSYYTTWRNIPEDSRLFV
jgi:hypothetical protein